MNVAKIPVFVIEQENQSVLGMPFIKAAAALQIQNLVLLSPDF